MDTKNPLSPQTRLVQLLGEDTNLLNKVLSQAMGEHGLAFGNDICSAFLAYQNGVHIQLLLELSLKAEFERVKDAPHAVYTLFRSNNTPVAAVKQFMNHYGGSYLKKIGVLLQQTISQKSSATPLDWATVIIENVVASWDEVPEPIRILFGMISNHVDMAGLMEHRDLIFGALFFFRFVTPYLLSQSEEREINMDTTLSKSLIEMAKIITSLVSNNTGTNEQINFFIESHTSLLRSFYQKLPVLGVALNTNLLPVVLSTEKDFKSFPGFFVEALEGLLQEHEGQDSEKDEYYQTLIAQFKPLVPLVSETPRPPPKRKSSLSIMRDRLRETLRRTRSESPEKNS